MKSLHHLFAYEDYQLQDLWLHCYGTVTLKEAVGKFPAGTNFPMATFDSRNGKLSLFQANGPVVPEDKQHHFDTMIVPIA